MPIDAATARLARTRAGGRCEYCRMPASASPLSFTLDHIIARQHGGSDNEDNISVACPTCNSSKGPNVASIAAATGEPVRLYHPRRDRWSEHFAWNGPWLRGLTEVGTATIRILAINREDVVDFRWHLMSEGVSFTLPRD